MAKALYRKYRSKSWDEVIGQDHITTTLKNSIKSGKISHAYLLNGPRGVGKTSVARILAHEVNNLTYDESELRLDIIEIDAASNRRIDEIRDLRDKVHIAPTSAKYKVYIIDEVHMLTKEAFNALLKTLEEPPEHCIFILATTEIHKLPETIISRTQRFTFNPVSVEDVTNHLKAIAKKEKITISEPALVMLAQHGQGSFRDSISLLDQLRGYDKAITEREVSDLLGLPADEQITNLAVAVTSYDISQVTTKLEELRLAGFGAVLIAERLSTTIKDNLVNNPSSQSPDQINLLKSLLGVSTSSKPQEYLELLLLGYTLAHVKNTSAPSPPSSNTATPTTTDNTNQNESKTAKVTEKKPTSSSKSVTNKSDDFTWPAILDLIKIKSPSLYTVLRLANVEVQGSTIYLTFAFSLHYKKAIEIANKQLLKQAIIDNFKINELKIDYSVDKSAQQSAANSANNYVGNDVLENPTQANPSELNTISNIFGGGEVLES